MNSADRERVKELLARAARVAPSDRVTFIRQAAGADVQIAAEAIDLLATLDDPQFMSSPTRAGIVAALPDSTLTAEKPGALIGRYKLLQLIGEGGFGSVFLAEQTEPVQRRVALKIIKAGMDTKQVIARFEAERQAVALMDHPSIARVLDAGATAAGRPYFVMELVRGEPITRYCDRQRLPVRQRLTLFQDVCNAVQHAHQKGVIHRDLKPSNVLVTVADGEPLPKVIDFGIAKATSSRLTDKTLFTELHQLIGTPEYMSPEQADVSGLDVDTRSDVYSLGVLLYELLSGTTPIERGRLRSNPLAEIQRMIREEEPARPSLRLAHLASSAAEPIPGDARDHRSPADSSVLEIARGRGSDPSTLMKSVRGDLDWIVMKCLEKDRRRRYPTASALAEDVGRYLHDQPVQATPPGRIYTLRKFVRRNHRTVLASFIIVTILLIASGVSLVLGIRESRQRAAAERALSRAEKAETEARARADELGQVVKFQEGQLSKIDPQAMGVRLRADLLAKAREAGERAGNSPEEIAARVTALEANLAGADLTGMALTTLNENVFQTALTAIEAQFADDPLIRAQLLQSVATTLRELGLLDAATQPQQLALEIRRRLLGDDQIDTFMSLGNRGQLLLAKGKLDDAGIDLLATVEGLRRIVGEDHPESLKATINLGLLLQNQGKIAEAEALYRDTLESMRRVLGDAHRETLSAISNLCILLVEESRYAEAEPYLHEVLQSRRRVLGAEHMETLISIHHMARLLHAQGKFQEAEAYFRESLEKHRLILGDDHPNTLSAIMSMGYMLRTQGRLAEVEAYYQEALDKQRRLMGDDHPDTITSVHNMGFLLLAQGRFAEAESYCREAMDRWRRLLGNEHPDTLIAVNNFGLVLLAQGKLSEAEPYCREALESRRRVRGPEHADTLISMTNMGSLLHAQGKFAEAILLLSPVEPAVRQSFIGDNAIRLGRFLTALGCARADAHEFATAEHVLTEAHDIISRAKGSMNRDRTEVLSCLEKLYDAWHTAEPAMGYDQQADEWRLAAAKANSGF